MRILVADDDAVTRRLLEATLRKSGWDVVTAEDGADAWRSLTSLEGKNAPELVLLDWMMPGFEGPEICRRLRSTPGFELTYVILLTSRTDKEDLSTGLSAGANDYIAKPFHPVELEARVRVGERMIKLQTSLAARVKPESARSREQVSKQTANLGRLRLHLLLGRCALLFESGTETLRRLSLPVLPAELFSRQHSKDDR